MYLGGGVTYGWRGKDVGGEIMFVGGGVRCLGGGVRWGG